MRHTTPTITVLSAAAALAATMLIGCQGTTAQGTMYTVQPTRELATHLSGDLERVHNAALAVLQEHFKYRLEDAALDAREGIIRARTARDYQVRVETFKHSDDITRIEVYVGAWGAEPIGRDILSRIEERLAETAAAEK